MEKILKDFLINEAINLEYIEHNSKQLSFMEILGVENKELQHSNFLAWLFDPLASHGFDDFFLKSFINLIHFDDAIKIKLNLADLSTTVVFREFNNIDILIRNTSLKFSICIENKIWANLENHQLEKYFDTVEEYSVEKDFCNLYVLLTPFPFNLPENFEDIYQNITYADICHLLSEALKIYTPTPKILHIITDYIDNLNKNIMNNNTISKNLAQAIYQKYSAAIDYIWNNRPDFMSLFEKINQYFKESSQYENLTPNDNNKKIIRILPKSVANIFKNENFKSWVGTDSFFAIELFCEKNGVWVKFCFGDIADKTENNLQLIKTNMFDKMRTFTSLSGYKSNNRTKSTSRYPAVAILTIINVKENIVGSSDSLMAAFLAKFNEFETNVLNTWTNEVNSKLK